MLWLVQSTMKALKISNGSRSIVVQQLIKSAPVSYENKSKRVATIEDKPVDEQERYKTRYGGCVMKSS